MEKTRARTRATAPALAASKTADRRKRRGEAAPRVETEEGIESIEGLIREVRRQLNADAVTIAVRRDGNERLIVCNRDGEVRAAAGSLSLGLVSRGPSRLSGGAGLLQAVECCTLFGFVPTGYLGAPFEKRQASVRGGIAAWTRRPRRWAAEEGTLLRQLASYCVERD